MIHLHLHTVYSLLDGLVAPKDLANRLTDLKMSACAITDHGHMGGAIRFYQALKKVGVKPILGMEANLGSGHIVLLARDNDGYARLMDLATRQTRGPLTFADLGDPGGHLIALTGCVLGHVPAALVKRDVDKARAILRRLVGVFGRANVAVELQFHGPMATLAPALSDLALSESVLTVATNDVHYLERDDAEAQNVLMAIRQGRKLGDPRLFQHPRPEYHLKNETEMLEGQGLSFRKSIENTHVLADMCDVKLDLGRPDLPKFADDEDALLSSMAKKAFKAHNFPPGEYAQRFIHELATIQNMGYSGYYLIVQDFCNWARDNGVYVGPGRGSGAGSLIAYITGITDLDPLPLGLFFERFLNPERVSMPDFDIDFAQAGRERVIDYVKDRYGQENVGQIATYIGLKPKSAIKDVARAYDMPFQEVNDYTRVIPDTLRAKTDYEKNLHPFDFAMSFAPALAANGEYDNVLKIARKLTGALRQMGKHPGGVVIGRRPLAEYSPLTAEGATAYDMKDAEAVGLVKFDFLGVKTLDVIQIAAGGRDMRTVPLDDAGVYEMMARGDTWGMFQVETGGMTRLCRDLVPECFNDVSAAVALYRPGPKESGMLDSFVNRRHGREKVVPPHPKLASVLDYTWGTLIYQEQVMQAAQVLAGYSLGGADLLRRAMGKKIQSEMDAQRQDFVDGCQKTSGMTRDEASHLFDVIDKFAGYGFNKTVDKDTSIITLCGYKRIEDCVHGDTVLSIFDGDVIASHVVELHDHGVVPMWEVEFDDGTVEKCTIDHKWLTSYGKVSLFEIVDLDLAVWGVTKNAKGNVQASCHMQKMSEYDKKIRHGMDVGVEVWDKTTHAKGNGDSPSTMQEMSFPCQDRDSRNHTKENVMWEDSECSKGGGKKTSGILSEMQEEETRDTLKDHGLIDCHRRDSSNLFRNRKKDIASSGNTDGESKRLEKMEKKSSRRTCEVNRQSPKDLEEIVDGGIFRAVSGDNGLREKRADKVRFGEKTSRFRKQADDDGGGGRWSVAFSCGEWRKVSEEGTRKRQDVGGGDFEKGVVIGEDLHGELRELRKVYDHRLTRTSLGPKGSGIVLGDDLVPRKVVRVTYVGRRQGYDLEIDNSEHNYLTSSGLCSSNSHSAAYALVAYHTGWLKLHRPLQFAAALMTIEGGHMETLARYVRDVRAAGIKILLPDVNKSGAEFRVEDGAVRWGLSSVKGLGDAQIPGLVAGAPYADFFDLVRRSGLSPQALKTLASVGACDSMGVERPRLLATVASAMDDRRQEQLDGARGQALMFDVEPVLAREFGDWDVFEGAWHEFRYLGAFVSNHPARELVWNLRGMRVGGIVVDSHVKYNKRGREWAVVTLEDEDGHLPVTFFADEYARYNHKIVVGEPLVVDLKDGGDEAKASECWRLEEVSK